MAPKRPPPTEEPPAASSSSEEEEETSSGEEEGSSASEEEEEEEEEQQQQTQKASSQNLSSPPPKSAPKKLASAPQQPESESESGSESESESGSESESEEDAPKAVKIKPIASKPMEETPTKKPRSKTSAVAATASKSTLAKRVGGETDRDSKDSKKAKNKEPEAEDGAGEKTEEKKALFQRVWSEDDEIAVLKGIIDFTEKKGIDPLKDINAFLEFIKKLLSFDVTISQLKDKVGRLKRRFNKRASKSGEDITFSKPHEQKVFDLWKKIWGSEGISGAESSVKANGKAKNNNAKNQRENSKSLAALKVELGMTAGNDKEGENDKMEVDVGMNSQFGKSIGVAGMEDYVIKKGLDSVKGKKKIEMEEKWKKLHVAELELFLRRHELIVEQAKLLLASFKTED